jgi:hypothetical protein
VKPESDCLGRPPLGWCGGILNLAQLGRARARLNVADRGVDATSRHT